MSNFIDKAEEIFHNPNEPERESFKLFFKAYDLLKQVHTKATLDTDNIETVYGALEMAAFCGHLGDLTKEELEKKLLPAVKLVIARTIEESIRFPFRGGIACPPSPYESLYQSLLQLPDHYNNVAFITFNYDLCLEYTFNYFQAPFSYCINETLEDNIIPLLKLHGSLNWFANDENIYELNVTELNAKQTDKDWECFFDPPTQIIKTKGLDHTSNAPVIVPPSWDKGGFQRQIQPAWKVASKCLREAEYLFFIGYSMPESDAFFRYLFALGTAGSTRIKKIHVIDINPEKGVVDQHYRSLFSPSSINRYKYDKSEFEQRAVLLNNLLYK